MLYRYYKENDLKRNRQARWEMANAMDLNLDRGETIHNWSLQPFSQDYNLASHTTCVVCINCIHEWRHLQLEVDSEEKLFMALLFSLRVFARNMLKKSCRRNIFIFWIKCLT